jgi:Tetratricopeptide repeat
MQWLEHPRRRVRVVAAGTSPGGGLPVEVPLGRLPDVVRGRDELLAELRRMLGRSSRRRGRTWVLAGMGGVGKSTVALAAARMARVRGWQVWWVTATDAGSLTGGMLEVLHQLGAPESVTGPVGEEAPAAAGRAWAFLNGARRAGRRWLLVFDNADDPGVLAAPGSASPGDYAGWLRPDPAGMVVVTSRTRDPQTWGPGVILRELRPLDDRAAAKVLTDLSPQAGEQARDLAHRLGGLPLALHLAGSYLASSFARWDSFTAYRQALDGAGLPTALADLDDPRVQARAAIQQTWDLSLDALAADGRPQTRQLLLLLSCYAPATPIPASLLGPAALSELLAAGQAPELSRQAAEAGQERLLRDGLHGLETVGLIDVAGTGAGRVITVHPVVADVNRSRLLTIVRPSLLTVADTAVRLLQVATVGRDHRQPADWPAWRQLAPHVTALLDWLGAHLDENSLTELLHVSARAVRALSRSGQHAAAERLARLSMTVAACLGDDHPANLMARQIFGAAIADQGHQGEAEHLYYQVLAAQRRVLGEEHRDTLATRRRLATSVGHQGRYAEAEQMWRQLLPEQERILGVEHRMRSPAAVTSPG